MSARSAKGSLSVKKANKEQTPKASKLRTALSWTVNIVCIVIIVFSLAVAVSTIIRTSNDDGVANLFGTVFMPVKTDSMSGTFEVGDLILGKVYDGDGSDLKVGQVITYKARENNGNGQVVEILKTHRISYSDGKGLFKAVGDNPKYSGSEDTVVASSIVAVWGGVSEDGTPVAGKVWKGMGKMELWLSDAEKGRTRFFCAIVLPLILLFAGYAFVLICTLVIAKLDKVKAEQNAAALTADALSEEEKRRVAEEYLASLARARDGDTADTAADTDDDDGADASARDAEQ